MIRLLHLSDIHFRAPECQSPFLDRDAPIRDRLLNDIEQITKEHDKSIDAIMITGDIAFAAKAEEYEVAATWIEELCHHTGCKPENVYVVPGNHDVNRNDASSSVLCSLREQLQREPDREKREQLLRRQFSDSIAKTALSTPMNEYNKFAQRYQCNISTDTPFWESTIALSDTIDLKLRGLTSTFFSSADDALNNMILGQNQTTFRQRAGQLYITLMHHPFSWFIDCDEVNDELKNNTHVSLVGHKHRVRIEEAENFLCVNAGALHPERGYGQYEPGYNLLDFEHQTKDELDFVNITTHIRVLQKDPDIFISKRNKLGGEFFTTEIQIKPKLISTDNSFLKAKTDKSILQEHTQIENITPEDKERELIYLFWGLTGSSKRKIMDDLALLNDVEWDLPDVERQKRAFINAKASGKYKQLEEMILQTRNK